MERVLLERDSKLPTHSATPAFFDILTDLPANTDMNLSDGPVKDSHQWRTERFLPPSRIEHCTPRSLADDVVKPLLDVVAVRPLNRL